MSQKVAIVTGSNKGIGYAIVKGLCERFNGIVYLTSRNVSRGEAAIEKLKNLGFKPVFHQLDVDDDKSVNAFRDYLKEKHEGIDLLVNNAAIAFSNASTAPVEQQAKETIRTNYFGLARVCHALFPLLRNNGRVVNVSSSAGHLSRIPSESLRKQLGDANLKEDKLDELMKQFVSDAKDGNHVDKGWGNSCYAVSKVGVTALTMLQQRAFNAEQPNRNISVNAVHPGYVDTDMTNHKGPLTIEEGAKAPLYLALEPHSLKGEYVWNDSKVYDWFAASAVPKV